MTNINDRGDAWCGAGASHPRTMYAVAADTSRSTLLLVAASRLDRVSRQLAGEHLRRVSCNPPGTIAELSHTKHRITLYMHQHAWRPSGHTIMACSTMQVGKEDVYGAGRHR